VNLTGLIPFIVVAVILLALAALVLTVNGPRRSGGLAHQLREHEQETAQRKREDSGEEEVPGA